MIKCLGKTVTDNYVIYEKIKKRSNLRNDCYHEVHSLLSSRLQPMRVIIKIRTKILSIVLHECETCAFILKEREDKICLRR
jgi:hypothetical protein